MTRDPMRKRLWAFFATFAGVALPAVVVLNILCFCAHAPRFGEQPSSTRHCDSHVAKGFSDRAEDLGERRSGGPAACTHCQGGDGALVAASSPHSTGRTAVSVSFVAALISSASEARPARAANGPSAPLLPPDLFIRYCALLI